METDMLKTKRKYCQPTVQVVEIKNSGLLLLNSASLKGYQYQEDVWTDE
jgi:hypothetical protein